MKKSFAFASFFVLVSLLINVSWAHDNVIVRPFAAITFAKLPKSSPGFPEGIAADRYGNIYVGTFSFTETNVIHVFRPNGRLRFSIPLPGVVPLGLAFDSSGNLFVADFGNGNVLKFEPPFSPSSTPAATIPIPMCGGATMGCGLNDMTFDRSGNLYVSDSFGGRIFQISPSSVVSEFFSGPMLTTTGFPGFGANGLAFNKYETALFVANTGDDRILKIAINSDGSAGDIDTFTESINGADGIAFDYHGNLWVAANQADQVVALDKNGRVIAELSEFLGIRKNRSARGSIFPASLVIVWNKIFVTNLALPLTGVEGDEWEEEVERYTVSRIRIPKRLR